MSSEEQKIDHEAVARSKLLAALDPDLTDSHDAYTLYVMAEVRIRRQEERLVALEADNERLRGENRNLKNKLDEFLFS